MNKLPKQHPWLPGPKSHGEKQGHPDSEGTAWIFAHTVSAFHSKTEHCCVPPLALPWWHCAGVKSNRYFQPSKNYQSHPVYKDNTQSCESVPISASQGNLGAPTRVFCLGSSVNFGRDYLSSPHLLLQFTSRKGPRENVDSFGLSHWVLEPWRALLKGPCSTGPARGSSGQPPAMQSAQWDAGFGFHLPTLLLSPHAASIFSHLPPHFPLLARRHRCAEPYL